MTGNFIWVVNPVMVSRDARDAGQPAADWDVIEQVLARMREDGGRATPARRLLLSALLENPRHRSAEELAADVQAHAPDVNRSTIYRNLEELQRLSVIDRTQSGHGPPPTTSP